MFPPKCYHCRESLSTSHQFLCKPCTDLLELLSPRSRCTTCFRELERAGKCALCRLQDRGLKRVAAALGYEGPAGSLVRRLKYYNQAYLSEGLAGYLVAQWMQLDWPMPDLIVPAPIAMTHWLQRGYNQSELLAVETGKILNCPVVNPLRRRSGDYSQAGLNRKQRRELTSQTFYLHKDAPSIADQTILLIDDVMTTGSTLEKCAEVLHEGFPSAIYALTVAASA